MKHVFIYEHRLNFRVKKMTEVLDITRSGVICHSDRGVQDASRQYRSLLKKYGFIQSMSRNGSFWKILSLPIVASYFTPACSTTDSAPILSAIYELARA